MSILAKLRTIAIAKFSDKSNLGDWYQKRMDICDLCPYNSKNKPQLTVKEAAMVSLNFGKDTCLGCGCEIAAKTSVREETCGLVKIGQAPLWGPLPEIQTADYSDLRIENLSADKVKMNVGKQIILDYGTIKHKSDSTIQISIKDDDNQILSVNTRAGCSCTVTQPIKKGDTFFVTIKYDTNRLGRFEKDITFIIRKTNKTQQFISTIVGTVQK